MLIKEAVAKCDIILLQPLFWGRRKIAQIGQTEPVGATRKRTSVRREVKFVQNTMHFIIEIR